MARVRNVGSIGRSRNVKPIPVQHFIPPAFKPIWQITLVTDDETIDITDIVVDGQYTDGITRTIGNFSFRFLDPSNTISDKLSDFDEIRIKIDYGSTATTQRFVGKIERRMNSEHIYMIVSGRSNAMITTGTNITYSSNGEKYRSEILKEIINLKDVDGVTPKYFGGLISDAGIEDDLGTIDVEYFEQPFWDIVRDICEKGGRDAYISQDLIFNYFEIGTRFNTTEAIVENVNLISTAEFGNDTEEIVTEVRAYGNLIQGIPVISTSEKDTSRTKGIDKQSKIDNRNARTVNQAKELANAEFQNKKTVPTIGTISSLLLPTLLPGEQIKIANPINKLAPDYYEIESFSHVFSVEEIKTVCTIKKQRTTISRAITANLKFQKQITANDNPRDLDSSLIYNFSDTSGTFNNTTRSFVADGSSGYYVLKTSSGNSGSWTSDNVSFDFNIKEIEFRITGDSLGGTPPEGTKLRYSLDGGSTFKTWGIGDVTLENVNQLQIQVIFSSSVTQVRAVGALYTLYD